MSGLWVLLMEADESCRKEITIEMERNSGCTEIFTWKYGGCGRCRVGCYGVVNILGYNHTFQQVCCKYSKVKVGGLLVGSH